jgi:hypothetical protein
VTRVPDSGASASPIRPDRRMASLTNWTNPRMTELTCADFQSMRLPSQRRRSAIGKAAPDASLCWSPRSETHAHGEVFAQDSLLSQPKFSEGIFMGILCDAPLIRLVHRSDISNSVWPRLDWREVDRSSSLSTRTAPLRRGAPDRQAAIAPDDDKRTLDRTYTLCWFRHFSGGTAGLSGLDLWFYLR